MGDSEVSHSPAEIPSHAEIPIPASLKFLMMNLKSVNAVSLTSDNYPIWSTQVLKLFRANGFDGFLTGTNTCPSKHTALSNGTISINLLYFHWQMLDQNLSAALLSTVSTSILPYILNIDTTSEIWHTLQKRLQAQNHSKVTQLKNELHNLSLKTNTMTHFLSEVKTTIDQIAVAGSTVDTEDIILYILNGLPSSYQSFKITIRTRSAPISLHELYSLLLSEEINISLETAKENVPSQIALYSSITRGRGGPYRGRSRGRTTLQENRALPAVTIVGIFAKNCR